MAKVIWLTGISGSGKSTLGGMLARKLENKGLPVEFLDGDKVRAFFEGDLGYTRKERLLNVRRIAFSAMLLAKHGVNVVVSNIAPYYEVRDFIREKLSQNYLQIYLRVSLEEVFRRDPQGHYAKFQSNECQNLIGVDDVYDEPRNPDLIVDSEQETVEESFAKILDLLKKRQVI